MLNFALQKLILGIKQAKKEIPKDARDRIKAIQQEMADVMNFGTDSEDEIDVIDVQISEAEEQAEAEIEDKIEDEQKPPEVEEVEPVVEVEPEEQKVEEEEEQEVEEEIP